MINKEILELYKRALNLQKQGDFIKAYKIYKVLIKNKFQNQEFFLNFAEVCQNINKQNEILNIAINASIGVDPNFIKLGFETIPKGIKYNPKPKIIEVIDTFTQFSFTIPAAIKTVPHTGGVIVDKSANQNTNKCTRRISKPISINAGPATVTQII